MEEGRAKITPASDGVWHYIMRSFENIDPTIPREAVVKKLTEVVRQARRDGTLDTEIWDAMATPQELIREDLIAARSTPIMTAGERSRVSIIDKLPPEILDICFSRCNTADIAAFRLTCQACAKIGERHLFRNLHVMYVPTLNYYDL